MSGQVIHAKTRHDFPGAASGDRLRPIWNVRQTAQRSPTRGTIRCFSSHHCQSPARSAGGGTHPAAGRFRDVRATTRPNFECGEGPRPACPGTGDHRDFRSDLRRTGGVGTRAWIRSVVGWVPHALRRPRLDARTCRGGLSAVHRKRGHRRLLRAAGIHRRKGPRESRVAGAASPVGYPRRAA